MDRTIVPLLLATPGDRPWPLRWALALLTPVIATLLTLLVIDEEQGSYFPFYSAAVIVTALYGGIRPGFTALALCLASSVWFVTPHLLQYTKAHWDDAVRLAVFALLSVGLIVVIKALHHAGEALAAQRDSLAAALTDVRRLQALLPICAICKKVRTDSGYWQQIENYFTEHAGTGFTHGICPVCYEEFIKPDLERMRQRAMASTMERK